MVNTNTGVSCKCPVCLSECIPGRKDRARIVVALSRCNHQLHLDCLNSMLKSQPNAHQVRKFQKLVSIIFVKFLYTGRPISLFPWPKSQFSKYFHYKKLIYIVTLEFYLYLKAQPPYVYSQRIAENVGRE